MFEFPFLPWTPHPSTSIRNEIHSAVFFHFLSLTISVLNRKKFSWVKTIIKTWKHPRFFVETLFYYFFIISLVLFIILGTIQKFCYFQDCRNKTFRIGYTIIILKPIFKLFSWPQTCYLTVNCPSIFFILLRAINAQTRRTRRKRKENSVKIAFIVASENVFPSVPRPLLIKKGLNASLGASKIVQFVISQKKKRKTI